MQLSVFPASSDDPATEVHQVPGSHTASGLSLRERGGAGKGKGKVPCRCLDDGPGLSSVPWAGLWKSFLPPGWQPNPRSGLVLASQLYL